MYSKVPYHVVYIATEVEDNCCIVIADEHTCRSVVVRRSCCSSSLLHPDHLVHL